MNLHQKILLAFLALTITFGCTNKSEERLLQKAKKIHSRILTVDTHTDTPLMFTRKGYNFGGENNTSRGKVDLKKMEEGGLDAAFFAVFISQGERSPEKYIEANLRAIEIFDSIQSIVSRYSQRVGIAFSPSDAYKLKNDGKRAIYIGIENGYPIGRSTSLLDEYYHRGARYLTLCHTRNNDICDSSNDPTGPEHNGLSQFGVKVVEKLNELGMLVDVSHISDEAFYQVLQVSKVPAFASHSNAREICNNPRNLTDDMLRKLAQSGGVVQVCLLSSYVKTPEPYPARDSARNEVRRKYNHFQNLSPEIRKQAVDEWYAIDDIYPPILATVSDLVDHIDHIVKVAGIDHVGIGSDFDGGGALNGCIDASQMINITVELLRRGYSETEIEKIWGGNFMRIFQQAEDYANNL